MITKNHDENQVAIADVIFGDSSKSDQSKTGMVVRFGEKFGIFL